MNLVLLGLTVADGTDQLLLHIFFFYYCYYNFFFFYNL